MDALSDEAAGPLLDWATTRLNTASPPSGDGSPPEMSACASRLRRVLRRINRRAGQDPAESQAQRVHELLSRIEAVGDLGPSSKAQ